MGIELNNFRTAIASNEKWLSVSGEDKTGVVGKTSKDKISVSDLTKAKPGDISKAQDNIYLRGQLLEGIRSTLVSAKLMSMDLDPQTNKSTVVIHDQAVKTFFAEAEKTLFGKLDKAGRYGLDTASQDLDTKTVKSLLAKLDGLYQLKAAKLLNRDRCSLANESQRTAIRNLDAKALSTCLNISEKAAKKLNLTEVETVARGAYMVCTLESKDMRKTVVVDRQGQLMNGDLGFNAVHKELVGQGAEWLAGLIKPGQFKDAAFITGLLVSAEKALDGEYSVGNMISEGLLMDAPEDLALLEKLLFAMLPQALSQARQLQPQGDLKLETWWAALQLPGNPPPAKDANAGRDLGMALVEKLRSDFANVDGGLTSQDFEDIKNINSLPPKRYEFLQPKRMAYLSFMKNLTNGLPYEKTLFCAKFHCPPKPQDFMDGLNLHVKYLDSGVPINYENDSDQEILGAMFRDAKTSITGSQRLKGGSCNIHVSGSTFACGYGQKANTEQACQRLLDNGFTHRQLYAMSHFTNEGGCQLLSLFGFSQKSENARIDVGISQDDPKDLVVTCDYECLKSEGTDVLHSSNFDKETKFDQKLHVQVTIHPDGSVDCGELKLKPIGKNIVNHGDDDDFDFSQLEVGPLVHQDIVELNTTPEQERIMLNLDGQRLGQLCGVAGEGAQCLRLTRPIMMPDQQTVCCQVLGWNGVETGAMVFINRDGSYSLEADAGQRHYFACLNQRPQNVATFRGDPAFRQTAFDEGLIVDSFGPVEASELTYLESLIDMNPSNSNWFAGIFVLKACLVNMLPGVMDNLRANGALTGSPETHLAALWSALGLKGEMPAADDADLKKKFTVALATRVSSDIAEILGNDVTVKDVMGVYFPTDGSNNAVMEKFGLEFIKIVQSNFFSAFAAITGATYEDVLSTFKKDDFIPDSSKFFFTPKGGALEDSSIETDTYGKTTTMRKLKGAFANFQLHPNESSNLRYPDLHIVINGTQIEFSPKETLADEAAAQAAVFETSMRTAGFSDKQIVRSVNYLNENLFTFYKAMGISLKNVTFDIKSSPAGMKLKLSLPVVKHTGIELKGSDEQEQKDYGLTTKATGKTFVHEILVQHDGSFELLYNGIAKAA